MDKKASSATRQQDNTEHSNSNFVMKHGLSLVEFAKPFVVDHGGGGGGGATRRIMRILDVGCGTGEVTKELSQQADNLVCIGMDSDPDAIAKARDQFPELTFMEGDVRNFQIDGGGGGGPVDLVFSSATLHWIPPSDADRSVQAMANALKPGGHFIVGFGANGNLQKLIKATQQVLDLTAEDDISNPWYYPSIAEYSSLLERHGIEVTMAMIDDRPAVMEDGDAGLKNWIRMFANLCHKHLQDNNEIERAVDALKDKLRSVDLYDDGTQQWTADYRRLRIVGTKV